MRKLCGTVVDYLRIGHGISSENPSTESIYAKLSRISPGVKALFVPILPTLLFTTFSPAKVASAPLIEHYFYPVSTTPINNYSQGN